MPGLEPDSDTVQEPGSVPDCHEGSELSEQSEKQRDSAYKAGSEAADSEL